MASGQFLSDLGSGIFERLGGLRKEQEAKDTEQKGQIIQLLGSLANQVEPESLPVLMRHLGDTIGIKGKLRGFWDAFSGMPDRSIGDQIGTKLRDLTSGGLVGPETAKKARTGGDMARLFQPTTPEQQTNRASRIQNEADLSGKMVLRDPRAEKLQEIEERYGAQFERQRSLALEKEGLLKQRVLEVEGERQKNRIELEQERALNAAEKEIKSEAILNARRQGRGSIAPQDWATAVDRVSNMRGLNKKLLIERIGLTSAKADEARAIAQSVDETGMRPGEARRIGIAERGEERGVEKLLGDAQAIEQAIKAKMASKANQITDAIKLFPGASFDPITGAITVKSDPQRPGVETGAGAAVGLLGSVQSLRSEYTKLLGDLKEAQIQSQNYQQMLEKIPKKPPQAQRPAPAQKGTPPTVTSPRRISRMKVSDPNNPDYEVGKIVPVRGKNYKIIGIDPDGTLILELFR